MQTIFTWIFIAIYRFVYSRYWDVRRDILVRDILHSIITFCENPRSSSSSEESYCFGCLKLCKDGSQMKNFYEYTWKAFQKRIQFRSHAWPDQKYIRMTTIHFLLYPYPMTYTHPFWPRIRWRSFCEVVHIYRSKNIVCNGVGKID